MIKVEARSKSKSKCSRCGAGSKSLGEGVEFIINCLRHRKSVWESISRIVPDNLEVWSWFVYRIAQYIDHLVFKLGVKLGNKDKAYEKLAEVFEKVIAPEIERIEGSLRGLPITIYLASGDMYDEIHVCVDLVERIDKQRFEEYRNIVKKLGLKYTGTANCKQLYKV